MATSGEHQRKRVALDRLRQSIDEFASSGAAVGASSVENERLLRELQAAVAQVDELLMLLEHHVRGPLTVVKGRAQLMRRHAMRAPQPDLRLVSGLAEIDAAVEGIVDRLDYLLGPPDGGADGSSTDVAH